MCVLHEEVQDQIGTDQAQPLPHWASFLRVRYTFFLVFLYFIVHCLILLSLSATAVTKYAILRFTRKLLELATSRFTSRGWIWHLVRK